MDDITFSESSKPYLIRGIYDYCTDLNFTPYIIAKIISGVNVPKDHVRDDEIVLNLSLDSTNKLIFDNDFISFSARFNGKNHDVFLPMESILGIYSKENNEGLTFKYNGCARPPTKRAPDKKQKPNLSIVKK